MAAQNRLTSVCHSIAHHAASGLCYVHPDLGRTVRASGESEALIDLLDRAHAPRPIIFRSHLEKAIGALRQRFAQILASEGLAVEDLAGAKLLFVFDPDADVTCSTVHACLTEKDGRRSRRAVDYLGAQAAPRSDF
jgi:hypothetical protein